MIALCPRTISPSRATGVRGEGDDGRLGRLRLALVVAHRARSLHPPRHAHLHLHHLRLLGKVSRLVTSQERQLVSLALQCRRML